MSLTAAATATTKLKIGTGVCLVNQRDPIQTAKLVASLDQVSAGRFLFGIGIGWNQDEMENHGTVFETRAKLTRERIEAMKEIWTKAKAEYHGEYVNFDPMMAWPKPVQKPHPPVLVGGAFPHGARRALRYGDGWIPIAGRAPLREALEKFQQMASEAGRDPATIPIATFGAARNLEELRKFRDLGVARVVVSLSSEGEDKICLSSTLGRSEFVACDLRALVRWAEEPAAGLSSTRYSAAAVASAIASRCQRCG